ncbi:hypothetical protein K6119_11295 [Paracrocinitomix mangrovi]|uniref:hypothetical protein n=1 Tax=Paracrocinitomix mangrovi TaxID=2862509 RepID=UPI001C8CF56A|nr:hypothetical protein [Paracrocinitomix mangrovi]UKN00319.1 hypothetical protein K6119_11295 [Paracrocinitomix mangrovi]
MKFFLLISPFFVLLSCNNVNLSEEPKSNEGLFYPDTVQFEQISTKILLDDNDIFDTIYTTYSSTFCGLQWRGIKLSNSNYFNEDTIKSWQFHQLDSMHFMVFDYSIGHSEFINTHMMSSINAKTEAFLVTWDSNIKDMDTIWTEHLYGFPCGNYLLETELDNSYDLIYYKKIAQIDTISFGVSCIYKGNNTKDKLDQFTNIIESVVIRN